MLLLREFLGDLHFHILQRLKKVFLGLKEILVSPEKMDHSWLLFLKILNESGASSSLSNLVTFSVLIPVYCQFKKYIELAVEELFLLL
ncbi:MAG: hypothetical protein MZV63_14825 [Marinilabiliales bacterium]|nr:hypothetical protein [Marinilabiliales bacterium]